MSPDENEAATFILPDFSNRNAMGSLTWIPTITSGDFVAGQQYDLHGVLTE
jgi:hypothetical protein